MHELTRQVRFSINPFLDANEMGHNSYASKPCGEGLAIYFALWVELQSKLEEATGFVVNVVDIDKAVRELAVPLFHEIVSENYLQQKHVSMAGLHDILRRVWATLDGNVGRAKLTGLVLELNPFKKLGISGIDDMFSYSEKFEFAATHKLWNDDYDEAGNFEMFGKCASANGHGHNYIVEVTIEKNTAPVEFSMGRFGKIVNEELIEKLDHKNLNLDVDVFKELNPTMENIAVFAWDSLDGKFGGGRLVSVTVWESEKTFCTYRGSGD
ncbi:MAG: 6-carboxytetrahydropterin synthase [Anaerohalosphaera sp.]|nr:6-carboxytetrahydropterin synthase [Anaerohalosphaera sp.]